MTDILIIVLVLGAGYWLIQSGKLDEIMGGLNLGEQTSTSIQSSGNEQSIVQTGPGDEIEVSGPGAGACVNGRCEGDPAAIRRAQELLEEIQN